MCIVVEDLLESDNALQSHKLNWKHEKLQEVKFIYFTTLQVSNFWRKKSFWLFVEITSLY